MGTFEREIQATPAVRVRVRVHIYVYIYTCVHYDIYLNVIRTRTARTGLQISPRPQLSRPRQQHTTQLVPGNPLFYPSTSRDLITSPIYLGENDEILHVRSNTQF